MSTERHQIETIDYKTQTPTRRTRVVVGFRGHGSGRGLLATRGRGHGTLPYDSKEYIKYKLYM